MKKLIISLMTVSILVLTLTGCGNKTASSDAENTSSQNITDVSEEEVNIDEIAPADNSVEDLDAVSDDASDTDTDDADDDDENYDTGDASLDNVRNQDEIGDQELLVVSFGTSFNDSRRLTIGAIEDTLEKSFSDYSVRRGFTADIVINHVQKRDGILIDNVDAALQRAIDNNVKTLVVQPTHLMNGLEYNDIVDQVAQYADGFEHVVFGEPLLTSDEDFKKVEQAIVDWTAEYDDGETAICFMGHGTEADSNGVYQKMQDLLTADGYKNYFIGTVEATPSLDDVLKAVQAGEYKRVILEPLMVVAGDHANNDMAGDEEDSWKSVFENAGYEVTCLLRGLGENEAIRQIYVEHAQAAIDSIGTEAENPSKSEENSDSSSEEDSIDETISQDSDTEDSELDSPASEVIATDASGVADFDGEPDEEL